MVHERNRALEDWEADDEDLSQNEIRGREQAVHNLTVETSFAEQRQLEQGGEREEDVLHEAAILSAKAHIRTREDVVREDNLGHKSGNMSASTRRQYLTALEAFKVSSCSHTVAVISPINAVRSPAKRSKNNPFETYSHSAMTPMQLTVESVMRFTRIRSLCTFKTSCLSALFKRLSLALRNSRDQTSQFYLRAARRCHLTQRPKQVL